jgi:hypothetical protein
LRSVSQPSGPLPDARPDGRAALHRGCVERGQRRIITREWIGRVGIGVGSEAGAFQRTRDTSHSIGQHPSDLIRARSR